jgi:N6-adenosine-specific RNA methylase IME4/DNA-binding XRE family transcriptional regulator
VTPPQATGSIVRPDIASAPSRLMDAVSGADLGALDLSRRGWPPPAAGQEAGEARLLPPLARAEYVALRADIEARGQEVPVVLDRAGRIISGWHRAAVGAELGRDVRVIVREFADDRERRREVYRDLARRHLSPEQVREIQAARRADYRVLRAEGATQESAAEAVGVPRSTAANWDAGAPESARLDLRLAIPRNSYPAIVGRINGGESQAAVAADYGVTRERVGQICRTHAIESEKLDSATPDYPQLHCWRCIVGDFPWPIKRFAKLGQDRSVELDYGTLSIADLYDLPIRDLAHPDGCQLWWWVVDEFRGAAKEWIMSMGFSRPVIITWVKNNGMPIPGGLRKTTEYLLCARIGDAPIRTPGLPRHFHQSEPGTLPHSRKTAAAMALIRAASYPPRREMYSRPPHHRGFYPWGNQADLGAWERGEFAPEPGQPGQGDGRTQPSAAREIARLEAQLARLHSGLAEAG